MVKIKGFSRRADKLEGEGKIEYSLWLDDNGELYVQFEKNITSSAAGGRLSKLLYSVSKYASHRNANGAISNLEGYNIDMVLKADANTTTSGYLKGVLKDLYQDKVVSS